MRNSPSSVHGRFQPFHNGHLNYIRATLENVQFLYVGITQVERNNMKYFDSAPHRSALDANPFSFFERKCMIEECLRDEGISDNCFSVIPFPLEKIDSLAEYFPIGGTCFTTIHSEWNNTKIKILIDAGYAVRVLNDPDKWNASRASATKIREMLRAGDDGWIQLVPAKAAELIRANWIGRFRQA